MQFPALVNERPIPQTAQINRSRAQIDLLGSSFLDHPAGLSPTRAIQKNKIAAPRVTIGPPIWDKKKRFHQLPLLHNYRPHTPLGNYEQG
jgi:hypothetical protein